MTFSISSHFKNRTSNETLENSSEKEKITGYKFRKMFEKDFIDLVPDVTYQFYFSDDTCAYLKENLKSVTIINLPFLHVIQKTAKKLLVPFFPFSAKAHSLKSNQFDLLPSEKIVFHSVVEITFKKLAQDISLTKDSRRSTRYPALRVNLTAKEIKEVKNDSDKGAFIKCITQYFPNTIVNLATPSYIQRTYDGSSLFISPKTSETYLFFKCMDLNLFPETPNPYLKRNLHSEPTRCTFKELKQILKEKFICSSLHIYLSKEEKEKASTYADKRRAFTDLSRAHFQRFLFNKKALFYTKCYIEQSSNGFIITPHNPFEKIVIQSISSNSNEIDKNLRNIPSVKNLEKFITLLQKMNERCYRVPSLHFELTNAQQQLFEKKQTIEAFTELIREYCPEHIFKFRTACYISRDESKLIFTPRFFTDQVECILYNEERFSDLDLALDTETEDLKDKLKVI